MHWDPQCTQLLEVGSEASWITATGKRRVRTPQGVVELDDGTLLLSFSAYDAGGKLPGNPMHESLGFATLHFSPKSNIVTPRSAQLMNATKQ